MTDDTTARTPTVLMIEDTPALARTYKGFLRDQPYALHHAETGGDGLAAFDALDPDAVLLDLRLPDMRGEDILTAIAARDDAPPVIVITAHGSVGVAVEAMRLGAADFLLKPFNAERLVDALETQIDRRRFARSLREADAVATPSPTGIGGFIGSSPSMREAYRVIENAARSTASVFITGESGTGKEVAAQAVHDLSDRARKRFVAINCAAIPGELMESEIFGHVRGAFTGAVADKQGAAQLAHGGTLFLDEICEMSIHLQSKLLRFIQTGTFSPVGRAAPEAVDVRFVCATNRDPLDEVAAGRFREDLYYRLHVIPLHLPPLRERGEDPALIAEKLLADYSAEERKDFSGLSDDARNAILSHPWPGNVRQLQNALRTAVVMNDGAVLTAGMLPGRAVAPVSDDPAPPAPASPAAPPPVDDIAALSKLIRPLADLEREAIERAIDLCHGDVRKAAVLLGVSPATIYRKRKHWAESAAG